MIISFYVFYMSKHVIETVEIATIHFVPVFGTSENGFKTNEISKFPWLMLEHVIQNEEIWKDHFVHFVVPPNMY